MSVQQEIEKWLTESRQRNLYEGFDIAQRLRHLQELMGEGDRPEQSFIQDWLERINEKETYSAAKLLDPLLDLWSFVYTKQEQDA